MNSCIDHKYNNSIKSKYIENFRKIKKTLTGVSAFIVGRFLKPLRSSTTSP